MKGEFISRWVALAKRVIVAWVDDYAPSMGAALSYYTIFSLAPLLLIVISIAGLVFGEDAARGEIFGQLRQLMGEEAAKTVESLLASANKPTQGTVATVVGLVALLIGSTSVFGELQGAFDRIWRSPARDKSGGVMGLLRARLLSFGMVLALAFLMLVSLIVSAGVAAVGKWWDFAFGSWEILAQVVNAAFSFAVTMAGFAMIYKLMPRAKVKWRDVWLGALVTAGLFTIGRVLIGIYIGKSGMASTFGAAGSLIVVLLWVYYSAQIFLLGAEFTWIYAQTHGSMRHLNAEAEVPASRTGKEDASSESAKSAKSSNRAFRNLRSP